MGADQDERVFSMEKMVEAKDKWREEQANLPYAEKLRILDKLHQRDLMLARSREKLKQEREE